MQKFLLTAIALAAIPFLTGACSRAETTPAAPATQPPPPTASLTSPPPTATLPPPTETATPPPSPTSTAAPPTAAQEETDALLNLYEGPEYGAFLDAVLTGDGDILAVGATNHLHMPPYSGDVLIMKLSPDGDILWERSWGGEGYDQAEALTLADDGGYYIFGETDSYGAGERDFFLLKVDQDGEEQWFKTYGGLRREWPFGMLQLANGELLVYGFSEPEEGQWRRQYALRLDPQGEVIWEYAAGESGEDIVSDALETPEGDLVLAVIAGQDGALVKLDAAGNLLWSQHYVLDGWQYGSQAAGTSDGGYLLAGFSMQPDQQADTWLARTDAAGNLLWETTFGEAGFDDYTTAMIQLEDGTYLLGKIADGIRLTQLDEEGSILWEDSYGGEDVYAIMALLEPGDGSYIAAGMLQITPGRSYDAALLRALP